MAFEPMVIQPSPESSAKIFSSAPKETLHPLSSHSLSAPLPQPLVTTSLLSVWDEPPNIMVSERSQTQKGPVLCDSIDRTIAFKMHRFIFLYVNKRAFQRSGKESMCQCRRHRDEGSIFGSERLWRTEFGKWYRRKGLSAGDPISFSGTSMATWVPKANSGTVTLNLGSTWEFLREALKKAMSTPPESLM